MDRHDCMIKIDNLTVNYKNTKAVENINLNIKKGEICTIIGKSGSGKSTILKVLAGINTEYEGKVCIDGNELNPKIQCVGFVPQNYGLIYWKTIEQNILLSSKIKHGKKNIDKELYRELIKELNLERHLKLYPKNLSGGEKQRAAIARAFLLKPSLLLMDEPFSALDVLTREEAQKIFLRVWKEHKVTSMLVTHDIKEAIYLGQKIIIMSSSPGKIEKIIENKLFGKSYSGFNESLEKMILEIKETLKGEENYEVR
ncbi:ABC transporter ATP-binding protein [Haloimpatiens sp. FM7330]|uniref:ABC transporter ATP-binding protein n=1 Tax=Haloimpatiens sp. FM7330 TaxID=3298610 RepID=UPI0036392C37